MASASSLSGERRPANAESMEGSNLSDTKSEKRATTNKKAWPSDEGPEGEEQEMTDIFNPDIDGADDTVSFEGSGNRPPPCSPQAYNAAESSSAGAVGPSHAAGRDVVSGGGRMDEAQKNRGGADDVDDLAGRRPRTLGLRALAQVREMSTVWQRRSRSGTKAQRRSGSAAIAMQPTVEADGQSAVIIYVPQHDARRIEKSGGTF
ncbi:uncharacterized protein LOC142573233 [Dermacentor variabilis]|uniref:uncharacterized protein LOC142573233 n=1 Tax=Dermacentor variabilis TaxID=34621 RepID=UPI003F5BA5B1